MKSHLSILAGNSRIEQDSNGLQIDIQPLAFEAGIKLAAELRSEENYIAVAIDHKANIKTLLDPRKSKKKSARLSHLQPEISEIYAPIAQQYSIPLEDIHVIFEKHCYSDIRRLTNCQEFYKPCQPECTSPCEKWVNCAGVTAAILHRLRRVLHNPDKDRIYTFWEQRIQWCDPIVITSGTRLAIEQLEMQEFPSQHISVQEKMFRLQGGVTNTEYLMDEEIGKVEVI